MGSTISSRRVHQGRNLKRLREACGIKQESMALDMKMSQQNISRYEASHEIDDETLARFAAILGVPAEVIKEMEDDLATYIIEHNTFENGSNNINNGTQNNSSIDSIIELCKEKEALLERMLKAEQAKNALLEQLLKSNGK